MPASWVRVTPPPATADIAWEEHFCLDVGPKIFVDGSGGQFTSDVRLRRCGLGAISWLRCSVVGVMRSILPGDRQTVPRAELLSFVLLIEDCGSELCRLREVAIASDCAGTTHAVRYVVEGPAYKEQKVKNMDLISGLRARHIATEGELNLTRGLVKVKKPPVRGRRSRRAYQQG